MIISEENTIVPICQSEDKLPFIPTGGVSSETPETIKEKYESNADRNAFTDFLKSAVEAATSWLENFGDAIVSHIGIIAGNPHGTKFSDLSDAPTELPDIYKGSYAAEYVPSPTSGNLTLKLSTETVLETTLTDANVFTVVLPTPATRVNESILIFKVGATLPAITLPVGITFPKPLVYEANKTHTIVFEQVAFNGIDYEIFGSYEIR